ncbi:hypothetical protein Tco_1165409 [Tanacetum coccineum]
MVKAPYCLAPSEMTSPDKSQGRRHPKTAFRTRKEEREQHLDTILRFLKDEKWYAKFSKYEFWLQEVQFLSYVVNAKRFHINLAKIEAIKKWEKITIDLVTKLPRTSREHDTF